LRRDIVFVIVFVVTTACCQFYGVHWKAASAFGLFAGFAGVGAWIIVVEDALNPKKRNEGQ
jgi:hypothetical protein